MCSAPSDLIGLVETFYEPNLSDDRWLQLIAEKLQPLIDRYQLGISGGLYNCPDPCSFAVTNLLICDLSESLQKVFFDGMRDLSPRFVAGAFLGMSVRLVADVKGWEDISTVRAGTLAAVGVADALSINVVEPDGFGCWFVSPQSARAPIPDDVYLTLTRIARHLAAAHRLRRKHAKSQTTPDVAEAVISPDGRIEKADGPAKATGKQVLLKRAMRSMDAARSRREHSDPRVAIARWRSMVGERWTLLDYFDSGSKRFVLAMENRPKPPSLGLVSQREREVLSRALRGLTNKSIAYEMELAESTVRVLLARAAAKVGARSRAHLLEVAKRFAGVAER